MISQIYAEVDHKFHQNNFYDIEANFVISSAFAYFEGKKACFSSLIVIGSSFIASLVFWTYNPGHNVLRHVDA